MKNKQHRSLMAEMDKQLRKVTIVSGMAQRLTNKVAIVTGGHPAAAPWRAGPSTFQHHACRTGRREEQVHRA